MIVPNETGEVNRVTDNIDVSVVDRSEGVFEAKNESHKHPDEHTYKVFTGESGDAVHCECPAFKHNSGLDSEGNCKHMRVVEQFARNLEWTDYQVGKKQDEEEQREKHMLAQQAGVDVGEVESVEAEQDDDELSSGERAAKEMVEDAREQAEETANEMPSKDEWREMSSEGRRRAVAFL